MRTAVVTGFISFLPLSAMAAIATLNIPMSTQQTLQQEIAAGQAGIAANMAAAEEANAQQAQPNTSATTPSNTNLPAKTPATPPVKVTPPPKPEVTDSTKASQANNVTLENQGNGENNTYPPAPTGFISSGGGNDDNNSDSGNWDYGF